MKCKFKFLEGLVFAEPVTYGIINLNLKYVGIHALYKSSDIRDVIN